ncbi:MAG TPA: hypothetical protein VFV81_04655, partial [Verrucomicrobiae bacterium]|nr:hypothetical protein [Verrucomicrobiae bacterium]
CAEETVTGGGVIIESADGFQVWDNRLPSRLRRLWPELRRQIARRLGLVTEIQSTSAGSA